MPPFQGLEFGDSVRSVQHFAFCVSLTRAEVVRISLWCHLAKIMMLAIEIIHL